MKQALSNVDVAALAAELRPLLVGARVERAYQPAKDQILLRLRRKGAGKLDLLMQQGRFLNVTRRAPANPDRPSMLAQVLRSHLENARVTGWEQVGFDRILRLDTERGDGKRSLVFELFGDGNLLLLDGEGTILLPMRGEEFGSRSLRKGEPYWPPPSGPHPLLLGLEEFAALGKAGKRDVVRFLAGDLGFGPLWAEELCLRSGVAKNKACAEMGPTDWEGLYAAVQALRADLDRNDLAPALVHKARPDAQADQAGEPVDAVPFVMRRYPAPEFSHEEAPTFREAVDAFFVGVAGAEDGDEPEDPRRLRFEEARGKVLQQVRQIEEAMARFRQEEAAHQADGEAVYASFTKVQDLLADLQKARAGRSWADVEAVLRHARQAGNALAAQVADLRPNEGSATLRITDAEGRPREVAVDLRLSVQANADAAFEAAKRQRARREGAQQALRDAQGRLADVEAKGLAAFGPAPARPERTSRHFWFESYRWTLTPGGLVAVGGRNAGQNDAVVKKYLRDGDRYVHAEIHGAPSVVVRPAEGPPADVPPEDLRAACHFAAVSSRAWRQAGPASAYWVNASQVSKTPRSGEYVPRGAWIIHGKRNAEPDLPMRWWVGKVHLTMDGRPVPADVAAAASPGRTVEKLVGATREALLQWTSAVVELEPGTIDPNDAAAALAEQFGVTTEEAQSVLPAGPVKMQIQRTYGMGTGASIDLNQPEEGI